MEPTVAVRIRERDHEGQRISRVRLTGLFGEAWALPGQVVPDLHVEDAREMVADGHAEYVGKGS